MPAEMVYCGTGDIDVRVSWGKDPAGVIQVASLVAARTPDFDPTQRIIDIVNSWLKPANLPLLSLEEIKRRMPDEMRGAEPSFDGYWATLDNWTSVNYLIKTLKKARDDAFGRPE